MQFSLVTSCFNNTNEVNEFCNRTIKILNKEFSEYEIILVNDASKDDTMEKIRLLCKKNKKIKAINLKQNLGQHYAIFYGLFLSKGKHVVVMDSDLEDEVNFIKTLIKSKNNNKAIFVQQKKLKNTTLSFLFWSFLSFVSFKKFDAGTSTFFIAPKKFVDKLKNFGLLAFAKADLKFLNLEIAYLKNNKIKNNLRVSTYNYLKLLRLASNHILRYNVITLFLIKYLKINLFIKKFEKKYIKELLNFKK